MKGPKKLNVRLTTTLALTVATALLLSVIAVAQKITSLNTTAKGKGTITISELDKHEITSVLVILKEGGEADLTFYADLQLAAQGTWSLGKSPGEGINLKMTGGVVSGNATGNGKLFLRKDGKSIEKLNIRATSADGSKVTVDFVADKDTPKENQPGLMQREAMKKLVTGWETAAGKPSGRYS
jgi:uncharacterized protein YxeA